MMPVKETSCQSKPKTSYSNAHAPVSRSSKIDIGFFFLCYLCFHQVNPRTNIELGRGDTQLKSGWRYVSNLTVYFHQMFRFRILIVSCIAHRVTQFKLELKFYLFRLIIPSVWWIVICIWCIESWPYINN